MSKTIILDKQSRTGVVPVQIKQFFSVSHEVTDEQYAALTAVWDQYQEMEAYFTQVYNCLRSQAGREAPAFPESLMPKAAPKPKAKAKPRAKKEAVDESAES